MTTALSRRRFFGVTAASAVALLAGCGGDDSRPTPSPSPHAEPSPTPIDHVEGYTDPARWAGRTLTVTSWGGEYEDAEERAIFEPFSRLTGAEVRTEATDLDKLRDNVEQRETDWDVCDVLTEDVLSLANVGLLEPIDFSIVDSASLFSDSVSEYWVGSSYFSTLLAFRAEAWPGTPDPKSWGDFWDLTRFPGPRGLHRDPRGSLEFALLADGVAMADLYPLDIDRAFASMEKIRESLTLFWEQGAQAAQSLTSGDLTMVSAWHNRILGIEGEGATVKLSWEGGALSGDSWVVPLGAPNRDMAMDFINFATRPEVCAAFATYAPFGPVNVQTFDLLPPGLAEHLPTGPGNRSVQFVIDHEWWFKHLEAVAPRFEEWITEHP